MSRDPEILHDEICARLDKIIELLNVNSKHSPPYTNNCHCAGSYPVNSAGLCTNCGYPKESMK